jgi:LPS export ABC transporter protein LptC
MGPYKRLKKSKLFWIAAVLVAIGISLYLYRGYRRSPPAPEASTAALEEGASMSVGRIHQTSTRDGKKDWSLEAGSAYYLESDRQVVLKDLAVTFFLEDNGEVYLTADQGILNTDSNDIEVSGHVVIKNKYYRLTTENLSYRHDRRILFSDVPVTVSGSSAEISAGSGSLDLNTKQIVLEGNVEGNFTANFALQPHG